MASQAIQISHLLSYTSSTCHQREGVFHFNHFENQLLKKSMHHTRHPTYHLNVEWINDIDGSAINGYTPSFILLWCEQCQHRIGTKTPPNKALSRSFELGVVTSYVPLGTPNMRPYLEEWHRVIDQWHALCYA